MTAVESRSERLLTAALVYAERGWAVLPLHSVEDEKCSCGSSTCRSAGKHPRIATGVRGASSNVAQIRSWWSEWSNANVGIALGEASGLWALDVDPRNGGDDSLIELQLANDDLPTTLHAKTGGDGEHFFFRASKADAIRNGKLAEGIDVKSSGGYVVAAPSVHASGREYSWSPSLDVEPTSAPDWVLTALRERGSSVFAGEGEPTELETRLEPEKVREIRSALGAVPADDREVWIGIGMALHSTRAGRQALELWTDWSKTSSKFDAEDQVRTWNSFRSDDGGRTLSTLFGIAKSNGWSEPVTVLPESGVKIAAVRESAQVPARVLRPPGILADISEYITRTAIRPQPLFSLVGALSIAANAMGRRYETETGLRSNLYLVAVGVTGCGKNHARSMIKRILNAADLTANLGGEELASGQSILSRASETPNVLFQLDEFGLLMKSVQNPNAGSHLAAILSILMKLFSSAGDIYVGTEYADRTKRPRVTIEYPCVNLHATTTPGTFFDALESKHVLSGYLNRLLVVESDVVRPPRQVRRASRDVPYPILDWLALASNPTSGTGSTLSNLSGVNPATPLLVAKTPVAATLFDEYDRKIDVEMDRTRGTGLDSIWNRAWEHADKVALVAAVAENPIEPRVTEEHARFAIALVNWSLENLIAQVRARVADSPFQSRLKECLRKIESSGARGMTEREMGRSSEFSKLTPKERDEVVESLVHAEQIARVELKTAGRPRVAYVRLED